MNFVIAALIYIFGWFVGFLATRYALKSKYDPDTKGSLIVVYDPDNPSHPFLGLGLDNLEYILSNDKILLGITKKGFPEKDSDSK